VTDGDFGSLRLANLTRTGGDWYCKKVPRVSGTCRHEEAQVADELHCLRYTGYKRFHRRILRQHWGIETLWPVYRACATLLPACRIP